MTDSEDKHEEAMKMAVLRIGTGCSYGCMILSLGIPILILMVLSLLTFQHLLG